jgi:hypothetical protein
MTKAATQRHRGRPRVGSKQINVRFPQQEVVALDNWIRGQPLISKPEAIRRLVKAAIELPVLRLERPISTATDYAMEFGGQMVGRIYKPGAAPRERSWLWTISAHCRQGSGPFNGYEPTRESVVKAFNIAWAAARAATPPKG